MNYVVLAFVSVISLALGTLTSLYLLERINTNQGKVSYIKYIQSDKYIEIELSGVNQSVKSKGKILIRDNKYMRQGSNQEYDNINAALVDSFLFLRAQYEATIETMEVIKSQ